MPRSHELLQEDPQARAEFAGQYGMHPNAEALVLAHQASLDPALEAASLKPVDAEATKELDPSSIEPERGGRVLDAVVRGGVIVYVAEGTDGRSYKGIQAPDDADLPQEDPSTAGLRAATKAEAKMAQLAATANANIEAKVAEFRAELQQQAAEALAEERESLQEEAQKAAEEAQEQAEEGEEQSTEPPSHPPAQEQAAASAQPEARPTRSRKSSS